MGQTHIIQGNEFATQVLKAMGINPAQTRRVVIDLPCDAPMKIHVEFYGDSALLNVDFSTVRVEVTPPEVDE